MRSTWLLVTTGLTCLISAGCPLGLLFPPEPASPTDGGIATAGDVELIVQVPDPFGTSREVVFYGRRDDAPGEDFTIVLLPDTQGYVESFPDIFLAQAQWIVDQRDTLNIAAVLHLGDLVETASVTAEWEVADAAFDILDVVPDLPYGLGVGNHDQHPHGDPDGTAEFNTHFPVSRYEAVRSWYGGHFGDNNDNHYILFSGGGLDFVAVFLEYDPAADPDVLAWANELLAQHADRRAIVVTHFTMLSHLLGSAFSAQGLDTYDALKHNPNLFLMLGGHFCEAGRRTDSFEGNAVHSLLADYQCRPNGGDGWLRLLEFSPAGNVIRVRAYSPTRDEYMTNLRNEFTLDYVMTGDAPFDELGRATLTAGAQEARVEWPNLETDARYDWYVTVTDGSTTTGPIWSFQTQ